MSSNWIAALGVVGGLAAFFAGLIQYRKAQKWKRLEFVAKEVTESFRDPRVSMALQMLDWNYNTYDLRAGIDDDSALGSVPVGDRDLERAMLPHPQRSDGYTLAEIRIRSAFDSLFDVLRRLEHFVVAGLVRQEDLEPYLRYWLGRLCGDSAEGKPSGVLRSLWQYIVFYRYDEVISLVRRYGRDPMQFLK